MSNEILNNNSLDDIFNVQQDQSGISTSTVAPSSQIGPASLAPIDIKNPDQIYLELSKLIRSGNELFDNIKVYSENNPENAELVTGASNLLGNIRESLKEFTKIYQMHLKHEQQKEIEVMRYEGKKALLSQKIEAVKQLKESANSNQLPTTSTGGEVQMLPFNQESIVAEIIKAESENKPQT